MTQNFATAVPLGSGAEHHLTAAEVQAVAHDPHRWSTYATSIRDAARLEQLLAILQSGPQDHVMIARQGHVLMMLGRTREALDLLHRRPERLCRAQRALALQQIGERERDPRRFNEVASLPASFGTLTPATALLDLEAQMRLDYALCQAHADLGDVAEAGVHAERARHAALLLGVDTLDRVLSRRMAACASAGGDPAAQARRTALLGLDAAENHNYPQADRMARLAMDTLLEHGELAGAGEVIGAVSRYLPELGQCWANAAAVLGDPAHTPPDPGDGQDRLIMLANAYHHAVMCVRAAQRLDRDEERRHATALLALPAWPRSARLSDQEVTHRVMLTVGHLALGQRREATVAVRQLLRENLTSPSAQISVAVATLNLVASGAAEPGELPAERAARNLVRLFTDASAERVQERMRFLVQVAPEVAVLVTRMGTDVPALAGVCAGVVVPDAFGEKGASLKLKGVPRDWRHVTEYWKGNRQDSTVRSNAHRYIRALSDGGFPPVALPWKLGPLLSHLRLLPD